MGIDTRLHGKIAHVDDAKAYHVPRLGGKCECCDESTIAFLEVCPVPGTPLTLSGFDGAGSFYAYLDQYPDQHPMRVLCANCWHSKRRHGERPPFIKNR